MKGEHEIERRLRSLRSLGEAVSAMKNLSAHHFRQTRSAVEPARLYRDGVVRVARWAGARLPAGSGPAALLVLGAELGLCGGYNAHVVAAAAERRLALGAGPTFCVGRRASILLSRRGVQVDHTWTGPAGVRGIPDLLLRLAEEMLGQYVTRELSAFEVVSSHFEGVGVSTVVNHRLLPIEEKNDPEAPRARYVEGDHLVAAAVRELLYVTLYEVILDALASEHGARLVATQAASEWLDRRAAALRRGVVAARREATTREVIEIAGGRRARAPE